MIRLEIDPDAPPSIWRGTTYSIPRPPKLRLGKGQRRSRRTTTTANARSAFWGSLIRRIYWAGNVIAPPISVHAIDWSNPNSPP